MPNFDFELTESGDILFKNTINLKPLKITFNLTRNYNECLKLSFNHSRLGIPEITSESLMLSVDFENNNEKYDIAYIKNNNEINQRIHNIIRTTLTDIVHNESYGTDLELYMHSNIRDKNNISIIENMILRALSTFLQSPTIKIVPKAELRSTGYYQGIDIYIYNYNKLIDLYKI